MGIKKINRVKRPFYLPTFLFLLCIVSAPLFSQTDITFKHITSEDGLGNNSIKCFCEDQYGFLWIGLEGGLDRYDGNNFLHFTVDPFDSTSLPDPVVDALHLDRDNRLWIGSSGGLTLFNYQKMSFTRIDLGLDPTYSTYVYSINESSENGEIVLWLSVINLGLVKYYPDEGKTQLFLSNPDDPNSLNDNIISSIHVDEDNILWLATLQGGLNKFNPTTEEFINYTNRKDDKYSISSNHIISVLSETVEGKKTIWLGSGNHGLIEFDTQKELFYNYRFSEPNKHSFSQDRVFSIEKYKGKILVGTAGSGLNIFDPLTKEFSQFTNSSLPSSIASNMITTGYKSHSGLVFYGTYPTGISYLDPNPTGFTTIPFKDNNNSITSYSVQSLTRTDNGDIYAGYLEGIDILHEKDMTITKLNDIPVLRDLLRNKTIVSLTASEYDKNIVWIGTLKDGLIKYKYSSGTYNIFKHDPANPKSISHNSISSLYEDSFGYLWFTGSNAALNKFDLSTEQTMRYISDINDEHSLGNISVNEIYEDSDRVLWICTEDGICRYNRDTDNFTRISFEENNIFTNSRYITSIVSDPVNNDILWIGSAAGLIRYNKTTDDFKRITTNEGLASNIVLSLLSHKESIWICLLNSISVINTLENTIINFDKSDGIEVDELNIAGYKHNNIYFGATNGLVYFNPDSIKIDNSVSDVVLTDLYLFNNKIKPGKISVLDSSITVTNKITLSYEDYVFGIEFTAPNFKGYKNQSFKYMLAGFHDEWIDALQENRLATFTNIPPGDYEFRVMVANRFGLWNESYKSLHIEITPPIWQTWWAYTLYIIFFVGSVWSFIEYRSLKLKRDKESLQIAVDERTSELKKLNANKDRFFSIVAHDIKSPLVALVKFTDIFKKQFTNLSEEERIESVGEINNTLNKSYRYLTNLLNWARVQIGRFEFNPSNISLKKMLDKNIHFMEMTAAPKEITIKNHLKEDISVYADYEMISIILRNLLSNSIKFTPRNGTISIRIVPSKENVTIEVEDTGIGMSEEQREKLFRIESVIRTRGTENEEGTGLGLILCNELVKKNNGNFVVVSTLGKGSTFSFTLPRS